MTACSPDFHQMNISVLILFDWNRKVALLLIHHALSMVDYRLRGFGFDGSAIGGGGGFDAAPTHWQERLPKGETPQCFRARAHSPRATAGQESGNTAWCGCSESDEKYKLKCRMTCRIWPAGLTRSLSSTSSIWVTEGDWGVIDEGKKEGVTRANSAAANPLNPCPYLSRRDNRLLIWTLSSQKTRIPSQLWDSSTALIAKCSLGNVKWIPRLRIEEGCRQVSESEGRAFAVMQWDGP